MTAKGVIWMGSSRTDIRKLPETARRRLGYELNRVQMGRLPTTWRPMGTVGHGVIEIRVHSGGAFRLIYVAKFTEAIYVLHVFQKKSAKTSPLDLAVARTRFAEVLRVQDKE